MFYKIAVSWADLMHPTGLFLVATVLEMPFPTGMFDFILVREVVEHTLDSSGMFRELSRCLRPGGHLGITTTDYNLLKKFIVALLWDRYFYPDNPHIRFYTKGTLSESLSAVGCTVVRHQWNGSHLGLMPWGQRVVAQKN